MGMKRGSTVVSASASGRKIAGSFAPAWDSNWSRSWSRGGEGGSRFGGATANATGHRLFGGDTAR